jgi:predicted translation initiation factor SUI1
MPFTLDGQWIPSENESEAPSNKPVKVRALKRKGVELTVVLNLNPNKHNLKQIARTLKSRLGIGGAVKEDTIELQGSKQQEVKQLLQELGIRSQ